MSTRHFKAAPLFPLIALTAALALAGCGGGSSHHGSAPPPPQGGDVPPPPPPQDNGITVRATVVDPYIEGAVFCLDLNNDGNCNADEPESTPSDANGKISFTLDEPIPANTKVIAKAGVLGIHNGVDFALPMSALLGANADNFVITPLTTFQADTATTDDQLTAQDIVDLLTNAGLTGLSEADITADPMAGVASLSGTVVVADLVKIRASLSVYGFMRLFNESDTLKNLTPAEIRASGDSNSSDPDHAIYQILSLMVNTISGAVSPAVISAAQGQIDAANGTFPPQVPSFMHLPPVTAEVIIKTGVAIIDRIVGDAAEACSNAGGDYTAGLSTAGTLAGSLGSLPGDLGMAYYGAHNKASLDALANMALGAGQANPFSAYPLLEQGRQCGSHFTVANNMATISCVDGL